MTLPKKSSFDKNASLMMKGIAILMMLAHHCFAFPEYWISPMPIHPIAENIFSNFKICVSIFAFITGYAFFISQSESFSKTVRKIPSFLAQYWVQLFCIFLPTASVHYSFSPYKIFLNMFALYDNIILFAWYVFFHLLVLLTFPLYVKLVSANLWCSLLAVCSVGYSITVVLYFIPLPSSPLLSLLIDCSIIYPVVGIGYIFAKFKLFDAILQKLRYPLLYAPLLLVLVFLCRSKLSVFKGFSFDIVYAPRSSLLACHYSKLSSRAL